MKKLINLFVFTLMILVSSSVFAQPDADFIPDQTEICSGETVIFTNYSSGGTSYEWWVDGILENTTLTSSNWSRAFTDLILTIHTVELKVINGALRDSVSRDITVNPITPVNFTSLGTTCVNSGSTDLTVYVDVPGGTFSGTGVSGDDFHPDIAGAGIHTITYTYTNGSLCTTVETEDITVYGLTPVNLAAFTDKCNDAAVFNLTGGTPAGGTYNINGGGTVTTMDPSAYSPGYHTIGYTITDGNGCTNSTTELQRILELPTAFISTAISTICEGTSTDMTAIAFGGQTPYTYAWLPNDGSLSSLITETVTASPITTTAYTVTITDLYGCTGTDGKTITVDPLPGIAGAVTGSSTVCQGQSTVTYSISAITDATSYTWTAPTGATIVSGQGTISIIVDYGTSAVDGNISVYGVNPCGNGTAANLAITVNPLPADAGTITGTATVCQGQSTVSYTVAAITYATSYVWAVPTGATIVSGSGTNSIIVDYGASAVSGNVNVYGTNACGNGVVSTNFAVTVDPLPGAAGVISGTSTVCQGQSTVSYTVAAIVDATSYVWAVPTGATIVSGSGTNSIIVDYGASATSGTMTVYGTNACGNGTISGGYNVTVNPLPVAAGVISGSATVCQGQSTVIYAVPSILYATSYVWTVPTGATIVSGSGTSMITVDFSTSALSGNVEVYGTNACGNGNSSAFAVTVDPLPGIAGTITGNTTVCQGDINVSYNVTAITNATSYVWSVPTGASITSGSGTNSITVTYSTIAVDGNIEVYGLNSCGTGTNSSLAITVNNLPGTPGPITGTDTVCQNTSSISYSIASILNVTYYGWTTPTGATIINGQGTTTITVDFGVNAVSGTITMDGQSLCGVVSATYDVVVNPLPADAGSISGAAIVCQGNSGISYSVASITYATSYIWSVPAGASIVSGSGTNSIIVDFGVTATSGDVTVQGINSCGTGAMSIHTITVDPLPGAAGIISGTATVCQSESGVSYSVIAITDATGYAWSIPSGATIVSGNNTNSIVVDFGVNAVSDDITVYGTNSCGNGTISPNFGVTVNPLPDASGAVSGQDTVCQSEINVIYSVTNITNATSYVWSLPTGCSITSGSGTNTITVNFASNAVSGDVNVYGVNGCGNGVTSANFAVFVKESPGPAGTISGATTVCQGSSGINYSLPAITNATSYVWFLPSGATIVSGSGTNNILVDFSASAISGNISVYGINDCNNGIPSSITITVDPLPSAAGTISGTTEVCQNDVGITYSVSAIANATSYSWTVPVGATITSGVGTNMITVDFGTNSGSVSVYGTNSCGAGASSNFNVNTNSLPIVNAGIDTTICNGFDYTMQASSDGTSFSWTPIAFLNDPNILNPTVINFTTTTEYTLEATNAAGCVNTDNVIITAATLINANAGSDTTICEGESVTLTATGGPSYLWSTGETTASIVVNPLTDTPYEVTVSNAGCTDTDDVTVFVNTKPSIDAGSDESICYGSSAILTATGGTTYLWSTSETTTSITVSPITIGTTTYTVVGTDAFGCSNTDTVAVVVNSIPGIILSPATIDVCDGTDYDLNGILATTIDGYWSGLGVDSVTGILSSSSLTAGNTYYPVYTLTNGTCTNTDSIAATIHSLPNLTLDMLSNPICRGNIVDLNATPSGGDWTGTGVLPGPVFNSNSSGVGTYYPTYTYTDISTGCTSIDSIQAVVVEPSNVTATPLASVCENGTTVDVNTAFSHSDLSWYFTGLGVDSLTGIFNPSIGANTYNIVYNGIDINGCPTTAATTITVNAKPTAVNITGGGDICDGDSINLGIDQSYVGSIYYLMNGAILIDSLTGTGSAQDFGYYDAIGTYGLQISNGLCSDTMTSNVTINVHPIPVIDLTWSSIEICNGDNVIIGGSATGADTCLWTPATGLSDPNILNPMANPIVNTDYVLLVTSAYGCTATANLNVTVNDAPIATFSVTGVDQNIITFTPTYTEGQIYTWDFGDGNDSIVYNFGGGMIDPMIYTYADTGMYDITLNVQNPCGDVDYSISWEVTSVGIENINAIDKNLSIYPNPTSQTLNVNLNVEANNEMNLFIIDLVGKVVYTQQNIGNYTSLDISNLEPGIYILSLNDSKGNRVTRKIVKE